MAIDRNGNSHKAAGRPDGGQFDRKAGQGSDDDLAATSDDGAVREGLDEYGRMLEDGTPMGEAAMRTLVEHMETNPNVRDAFLLMACSDRDSAWAANYIDSPHTPELRREVDDLLDQAGEDGIDIERRDRARKALGAMSRLSPRSSQPPAVNAYLLWISGEMRRAELSARVALRRDPGNMLAEQVRGLAHGGLGPQGWSH